MNWREVGGGTPCCFLGITRAFGRPETGCRRFAKDFPYFPNFPGRSPRRGSPPTAARRKLFGWSPGCWEFEAHRLTNPQHRIPTPPIQNSRSGPHADCSSGVPHPGSQTVSFIPACLCLRGSSNIRDDGICLMTAACLAKHFVSEVVVVPQFHFGSNFHSRHCSV